MSTNLMFGFFPEFSILALQITIFCLIGAIIFIGGLVIFQLWRLRKIERALKTFLSGKTGRDLEQVLLDQKEEVKTLDQEIQELFEISNRLRELCLKSLHKISIVRFNPFKEVGGNQSFSVVLLDGKNSGIILSSLHTREGTRMYAKPVLHGGADGFPFTEEEKKAITQALSGKGASH